MNRRLLLPILLFLCAQAVLAADPAALFQSGKTAMQGGKFEDAVDYFEKAIAAKPNDSNYYFWLGQAYGAQAQRANVLRQAGLASKTKNAFEKAVALDPNNNDARMGLIDYYKIAPGFMGGSDEKAAQQANEIKKRDSWAGHQAWARIHQRDDKPDLARKEYLDAVKEAPNGGEQRTWLAWFYASQDKNFKAAFAELETALQVAPTYMPTWYFLGRIAVLSSSNYVRGEEGLRKYLTYTPTDDEPNHGSTHYQLGQILERTGRKAEAKQHYAIARKMRPESKEIAEALKRVS